MAVNYNATVAKIKTIYGRRITRNDYEALLNMSSISDVAQYLKNNTHYSSILSNVDINTVYRGMLENLLRKDMFQTYLKITKFEGLAKQEFYNYMFLRSEITEILRCIRSINAKYFRHIDTVEIFYNPYTPVDFIELVKVKTFPELLELLKRTPYYNVLSDITPNEKGKVDFSRCEVKMRTYYLNRLLESVKFHKEDTEMLKFLITSDIDLINVINSYRLTAFFGANEKDIEEDILPFSGRLSRNKLIDIYSADTPSEFLSRFSKTYYGRTMIEQGLDVNNLEFSIQKLRYLFTKRALSKSDSAPLSVYSFMSLRSVEVHNLITIIEAIKYELPAAEIESLIII